jgi:hypothetical protein
MLRSLVRHARPPVTSRGKYFATSAYSSSGTPQDNAGGAAKTPKAREANVVGDASASPYPTSSYNDKKDNKGREAYRTNTNSWKDKSATKETVYHGKEPSGTSASHMERQSASFDPADKENTSSPKSTKSFSQTGDTDQNMNRSEHSWKEAPEKNMNKSDASSSQYFEGQITTPSSEKAQHEPWSAEQGPPQKGPDHAPSPTNLPF